MKTTKVIIILLVSFFFLQDIFAQEVVEKKEELKKITIDAELRTRGEILNGYKSLPTENNFANYTINQLTRLNFGFENDKMEFYISLQDSREWGEGDIYTATGNFGNTASIDVFQAWAKLKLSDNSNLQLGRQKLAVDDQRLVCARGWSNYGISYDAASLNYKKEGLTFSMVLSYNNETYNAFAADYGTIKMKSMDYIHVGKKFNDNFYASFITLFSGFQSDGSPTVIQFKNTSGLFVKYDDKKLLAKAEAYYQMGKTITSQDVAAYLFNAEAGYNFGAAYFGAGIDYLSGQDLNETEKYQSFDVLYGARFKYYGNLNYFLTSGSTKNGGLVNPFVKLGLKFKEKHSLTAYYHMFQLAQDVVNPTTTEVYDKNLGSEIDIMYKYKLNKEIQIEAGYHTAFVSETLEAFKGVAAGESETPQWFWLSITFKPTLFKSK
ncbi:MAG: alginate export family protein [Bacteroidales bacterium]|nr:alginate export family protein [Bacteroidales bacterium]MBN2757974.1 alginate export family protein [Bacteroidales bacterium]